MGGEEGGPRYRYLIRKKGRREEFGYLDPDGQETIKLTIFERGKVDMGSKGAGKVGGPWTLQREPSCWGRQEHRLESRGHPAHIPGCAKEAPRALRR